MILDRFFGGLQTPPPASLDRSQWTRCAALSAAIWLLHLFMARHSQYVTDDFNVIGALLDGGLWQFFHHAVRPIEYLAAWLSLQAQWPLWLLFSLVASVIAAVATLVFINTVTADHSAQWWKITLCAASPIAALPGFQIDTVSQSLANMFSLLLVLATLGAAHATDAATTRRRGWLTFALGAACLMSKETSYGLVLGCALLLLYRDRKSFAIPMVGLLVLLVATVTWSRFNTFDITPGAHYGIKANPFYWLFTIAYSSYVAISTIPSSLALTGSAWSNGLTIALTIAGGIAFAGLLVLLAFSLRALLRNTAAPTTGLRQALPLLALLLLASLTPALFFKAGELYATHAQPYLKALLAIAILASPWRHARRAAVALSLMWVLASFTNMTFYAISSGYTYSAGKEALTESAWTRDMRQAVDNQKRVYSVYSVINIGQNYQRGSCVFDPWTYQICLPADIMSGFPYRIATP